MKVLMINGSPNEKGCTNRGLLEIGKIFDENNIKWEIVQTGKKPIRDCIACGKCRELDNKCVFNDDIINEIIEKAKTADGFIFGTPVYYAHPSGKILSILDRVFYAGSSNFVHKPGAAIVSARRAGTTASIDVLNKYFTIANMPVISSSYWNMVHGNTAEEVENDEEGLQTMRNLARNMIWILNCINSGKNSGVEKPVLEKRYVTNFIR